jgi:hypothetical protein
MKTVLWVCLISHVALPQVVSGQEVLFDGLDLDLNALALRSKYPSSRHAFWPSDGGRIVSPRNNEEFEGALSDRSGRYLIRLSQEESFEDVYLLDIRFEEGGISEFHLSFEKPPDYLESEPQDWAASHYARHPDCHLVEAKLKDQFGEPSLESEWSEERLLHRPRSWSLPGQRVELDCYSLDGQGRALAAEVIFRRR